MVKEVRSFLGMLQYYRYLWKDCIHILAPLVELTGSKKNKKFEWNECCEKAFEKTKKVLARYMMLSYPNFSKIIVLHMDMSNLQLVAVISHEG